MTATSRIRALVQTKLVGRKIDVVGFVDEFLGIVAEAGEVRCWISSEQALRFEIHDDSCEVALDSCRGKLRMLCARLSVLCNEAASATVSPYGGEGVIRWPAHNGVEPSQCTVRYKNTPDEQEFTIVRARIETVKPAKAESIRGHGASLNGYADEDEGLYDDDSGE